MKTRKSLVLAYVAFSLALSLMLSFVGSIAYSAPASRLAYAQQCAAEMGALPTIHCMDGKVIPITKNGQPLSQATQGEDCDNPVQLGLGGGRQCVPHSRFLRVSTGNPDVETAVICRKYIGDDNGPNDTKFSDIAVVQHNKATGNTCFFQSHLEQHLDGTNVPSPQENSANASKYWLEPTASGPGNITCTGCHDADPFIWSKYIIQVADISKWDPFGKWNSNYQNAFGHSVKSFQPDNNKCVACHRIGDQNCRRSDDGGGHVSVKEVENKLWMPPGFSGTAAAWHSTYGASVEQLYSCCDNPSQAMCKTVDHKGGPVPPERFAAIWTKVGGGAQAARHGMTGAEYQSEFTKFANQGMRLKMVDGYDSGGQARFAAIWESAPSPAWVARHGMTGAEYQTEFNKNGGQGFRLVWVNGYNVGGNIFYAAIWDKSAGGAGIARHGMTSAEYQAEFTKNAAQGFRLKLISGYASGNEARYAAIWEKTAGPAWVARHGLNSADYQAEFNKNAGLGFSLVHVSGYRVGNNTLYAAIWEKSNVALVARHGMTADEYQAEFNLHGQDGFRLQQVSGY